MLRLVVFDFDGVLADSEPAHFEMIRQVLSSQGIDLTWELYCQKYLGYDDIECFRHILNDMGLDSSIDRVKELASSKSQGFVDYLKDNCILMEGVAELLIALRKANIAMAICSGALRCEIEFILDQAQLLDYFGVIVSAEDVTDGKPSPEGYQLSLANTNKILDDGNAISSCQCVAIEDSMWGIEAAKSAGMHCVAVATSYDQDELTHADAVVKDIANLSVSQLQKLVEE